MTNQFQVRLEIVLCPINIQDKVNPLEFLNLDSLSEMLENHNMLVPFDLRDGAVCRLLKNTGLFLVDKLQFLRRAGEVIAALGNNIIPFWATDRGKLNLDSCVSMLTKPCRKKHPFGVVLQLMSDKGKDITDIMTTGIRSLGLCFFPVVKTFDKSKHAYLSWNGVDLLHIDISTQETSDENSLCEFLTAEILLGLIQKKLIYRSKLLSIQQKRGFIFPWVKPVIVKLKGIKLSTEERASVLLFVTAVAFLQNHWYVNFEAMSRLLKKLPLAQIDLKLVQIQCRYLLKSYPGFHIFRHHESIPCRLNILEKKASIPDNCLFERFKSNQTVHNDDVSANEHEDPSNEPENTITESGLGLGDVVEVVETVPIRHLPSGYKIKWSSNELEVLHEIEDTMRGKPLREKYRHYQQLCVKKSIPDRTYNAFKIKLRKIINSFSGFNKLFVVVYSTVTNWPSGLKRHIKLPADRA